MQTSRISLQEWMAVYALPPINSEPISVHTILVVKVYIFDPATIYCSAAIKGIAQLLSFTPSSLAEGNPEIRSREEL